MVYLQWRHVLGSVVMCKSSSEGYVTSLGDTYGFNAQMLYLLFGKEQWDALTGVHLVVTRRPAGHVLLVNAR